MNISKLLTPQEAAKRLGISIKTLYRWEKSKKIEIVYTPNNRRRVPLSEVQKITKEDQIKKITRCCIYVRVSSKEEALNGTLQKQKDILLAKAQSQNYKVVRVIEEIGSSLKENRTDLKTILHLANEGEFDVLLVCDKTTILPFGLSYLEEQFFLLDVKIESLEIKPSAQSAKEIIKDMLSIIIHFLLLIDMRGDKNLTKIRWKLYRIRKMFLT